MSYKPKRPKVTCKRCGGTGQVRKFDTKTRSESTHECGACNGEGIIFSMQAYEEDIENDSVLNNEFYKI